MVVPNSTESNSLFSGEKLSFASIHNASLTSGTLLRLEMWSDFVDNVQSSFVLGAEFWFHCMKSTINRGPCQFVRTMNQP